MGSFNAMGRIYSMYSMEAIASIVSLGHTRMDSQQITTGSDSRP